MCEDIDVLTKSIDNLKDIFGFPNKLTLWPEDQDLPNDTSFYKSADFVIKEEQSDQEENIDTNQSESDSNGFTNLHESQTETSQRTSRNAKTPDPAVEPEFVEAAPIPESEVVEDTLKKTSKRTSRNAKTPEPTVESEVVEAAPEPVSEPEVIENTPKKTSQRTSRSAKTPDPAVEPEVIEAAPEPVP